MDGRTFVGVADADFDFALRVEDIELGDDQRIDAVDHFGVTQFRQIEPAAAARTASDGAKFLAALANFLGFQVGHFRGERAAANARGVCLGNAEDVADFRGRNAHASGGAARGGAGGGDERIGAVVDVEHGALGAFEQDGFAFIERAIGEFGGVANVSF